MLLDIKKLLFQIDNISDSMQGVKTENYQLVLDCTMSLVVKNCADRRKNRMIHIHSLKKLLELYAKYVDTDLGNHIEFCKFDENKFFKVKSWNDFYSLKKEIIQMYHTLFEYYPEKLI